MKLLIKLFTFTFVFISAPLYANNLSTINIEYIIEKNIEFQNFLNNLNEEQKLMNDIFKKKNYFSIKKMINFSCRISRMPNTVFLLSM